MNLTAFLEEATILDVQESLHANHFSSEDLVSFYLERIAAYDTGGPKLNSVLEINPDALFMARALDMERNLRGARSPLHGIPIVLKDNIDTGDKLHTSAGSRALADAYANQDAELVARLRAAGALIFAKVNMTEWANFMTDNMKNGYSSRGGQVLNPYGPGIFDVGGSSSGSGAAIAANLATASIGTETSGSVVSPASANSLVGLKPTVGLISRSGVIPIAPSMDTPGPLARNVTDVAVLLNALAAVDAKDAATGGVDHLRAADYTAFLDKEGLRGARIGIPRHYYKNLKGDHPALIETALEHLQRAGAEIIDPVTLRSESEETGYEVLFHEFKPALNAYLGSLAAHLPVHSLRELINYNQERAETMLKYGQTALIASEATNGRLTDGEYIRARLRDLRQTQREGIDEALVAHELDALLMPGAYGSAIAAKAGYPALCVPAGYLPSGCPFGITFVAGAFEEPLLLRLAYAFEQATKLRRPPTLD